MADITINSLALKNDNVPKSSDWPELTCSAAKQLEVNATINATGFKGDGSLLTGKVSTSGDTITGSLTIQNTLSVTGNVVIGTVSSGTKLDVKGDLTLDAGDNPVLFTGTGNVELNRYLSLLNSSDLRSASGLKAGGLLVSDTYAYANPSKNDLIVKGHVGIGTPNPIAKLQVADGAIIPSAGNAETAGIMFPKDPGGGGSDAAWLRYYPRTGEACTLELGISNDADDHIALISSGNVGIGTLNPQAKLDVDGNLKINGDFSFPNTGGGVARLTNQTFSNENTFKNNNVKLSLASSGLLVPGGTPPEYEFSIGHTQTSFVLNPGGMFRLVTNFSKKFSINQNGDAYFAGAKTGYVVDQFVNRVGDTLEQGDVVIISQYQVSHYSGSENNIPIPEVDLTEKAYDSRVCGIVAKVLTEQDLPYVEVEQEAQELPEGIEPEENTNVQPWVHPLQDFVTKVSDNFDPKKIQDQQLGQMVTLGAFAHCKVDADIAPIEVGDLLTTSTTKGHAQKVLEPHRAIGAIIGKALASLEKGKAKIPVLVILQ